MSFKIKTSYADGEPVTPTQGPIKWQNENGFRAVMLIPQLVGGHEVARIYTGIAAYASGKLLIPGMAAVECGTMEEAIRYAEAYIHLTMQEGGER